LEASPRYLVPVHSRPPHEFEALALVQEDVSALETIGLVLLGRKIHLKYVRDVDAVLEDVGDPQVRPHVRTMMVFRATLTAELHLADILDLGP